MEDVPLNKPYNGYLHSSGQLRVGGEVVGKAYFLDIRGREDPERTEWDYASLDRDEVLRGLEGLLTDGDVYVAGIFPHVTTVWKWGNPLEGNQETNLYRVLFLNTGDLSPAEWTGEYGAIGCPAEIALVCEEARLWAESGSVEEYLERFASFDPVCVREPNKLREHLLQQGD